jgi:hypothetical protein
MVDRSQRSTTAAAVRWHLRFDLAVDKLSARLAKTAGSSPLRSTGCRHTRTVDGKLDGQRIAVSEHGNNDHHGETREINWREKTDTFSPRWILSSWSSDQDGVDEQQLGLLRPSHRRHRVALDRFNETKLLVRASLSGSHPVRRTDRCSRPRPWRRLGIDYSCRRELPRAVVAASKRVDGNAGVSRWWVCRSAQGNNKASSYPCNCTGGVHRWRCFHNSAAATAAACEGIRVRKTPWFGCRRISAPRYTSWVRVYREIWPGRAKPKQRWALESNV